MTASYKLNRSYSDMKMPKCFEIMGRSNFKIADTESDQKRATDVFVSDEITGTEISVRVRRWGARDTDQGYFTIRNRAQGTKTEYDKMLEGHSKFMFYAVFAENNEDIAWYRFFDLDIFRSAVFENMGRRTHEKNTNGKINTFPLHCGQSTNGDGTGYLVFNSQSIHFTKHVDWMLDASDDYPFLTRFQKQFAA